MNFRHPSYLPNSEERIERLRRIINSRRVAIILHGVSATELEERIGELQDCDICYCSVGRFWIIEEHILEKIGRRLSVVMCSADPSGISYGAGIDVVVNFLEREGNTFISSQESFLFRGMNEFIKNYDEKLLFHETVMGPGYELFFHVPSAEYPLHFPLLPSVAILLSLVIIGGASKVAIFGADGGRISKDALYYRESELSFPGSEQVLFNDAGQFNAHMQGLLERMYQTYNIAPVEIVNCSLRSHYTPFEKLSYDDTFAWLKERNV